MVYKLNYNLPNKANKTSELPSELNKLNSNLPNETKRRLPAEVNKRDHNGPFPSSPQSLFQSESNCETFVMIISSNVNMNEN